MHSYRFLHSSSVIPEEFALVCKMLPYMSSYGTAVNGSIPFKCGRNPLINHCLNETVTIKIALNLQSSGSLAVE